VPFFAPAFHPGSELTFAGVPRATGTIREALAAQMRPPTFPVTLDRLVGARTFLDVPRAATFEIGPFRVTSLEQDHPDGVVAYRIEAGGSSVVFATDCEHRPGSAAGRESFEAMARLARGADVLIHDAQYTTEEYLGSGGPPRLGWGHSTVDDAVAIARAADCDRLFLFHHDPTRDDAAVSALESVARRGWRSTFAAREGASVVL
jgi:ribonuclease BN (tRNA processing enzyme)